MYPFRDGCFAPRNGWYVAAFSHEVGRTLLSRWILNEPVILYRTEADAVTAMDGRCPHRHFPLGQGRLEGDVVVCGYHGIAFGPDGGCRHVPSQTHVPAAYRIIVRMTIPADHPTRGGEVLTDRRVFHAVTPGKHRTTHYFFAMGGRLTDEDFARTREYLRPVIEEDAMATREIEAMLSTLDYVPGELMLKSDASAVLGRRALQAMMDRENALAASAAG